MNATNCEPVLPRELRDDNDLPRESRAALPGQTAMTVLACGVVYYLATQLAWNLCFSHTSVSVFFPPYAVLISILLLVPTRHWWAYTLVAVCGHLVAAYQAHWPLSFALYSEAFDALQNVSAAAGLRLFIKSPLKLLTLRDAVAFVLIAVIIVPFGTAFWGAALTLSYHYGTHYWVEWRKLGIANGVTAMVLVPAILLGVDHFVTRRFPVQRAQLFEAGLLAVGLLAIGGLTFATLPAGPETESVLLYAPIPLLVWAALRFGVGGTCASMLVITILAIGGAMRGRGPFLSQTPAENAQALQLFLLVTAAPLLFLAVAIDEERGTQSALRESEARFRAVADTAPVMIWVSGTDKLVTFLNKGWLDFTGRTMVQELGNGWAAGVHHDDFDHCLETYTVAFDARRTFAMEYRLRRGDGEYRWVFDNGAPRFSPDGTFLGFIGSCIDITAHKSAEEAAQQLTGRVIQAQEETRKHFARELHDDLSQSLALLSIELEMFGQSPSLRAGEIRARMEEFSRQVKVLSSEVHQLSHDLHPAKLEQLGLVAAVRGFCKEFALAHEIAVEFIEHDVPPHVPDTMALCLYRITQEALQNIVKHSLGTAGQVELAREEGQLRLRIADDGIGFDPLRMRTNGSLGLVSMYERARYVGGSVTIESSPGAGTRVEVRVSLDGADTHLPSESTSEGLAVR